MRLLTLMRLVAQPWTVWAVLVGGAFLFGASGRSPVQALEPAFLWGLASYGCRWFLRRRLGAFVPSEAPLPPAQLAVSVTPARAPGVCPDLTAMKRSLPTELRSLLDR